MELGVLQEALTEITAQWHEFGIQLGVKPSRLQQFQTYTSNVRFYLNQMLQVWLKKDPPPTILELIAALRSPVLSHNVLADKLEKEYKGNDNIVCTHNSFI